MYLTVRHAKNNYLIIKFKVNNKIFLLNISEYRQQYYNVKPTSDQKAVLRALRMSRFPVFHYTI